MSNVPLDDVCRALGRSRVVRVGPRGVRGAARANDAQFVAQAPSHAQLSRAGAAHRAAAHGEGGDHGRAVVDDVVELHRADPSHRNVPRGARVPSLCRELCQKVQTHGGTKTANNRETRARVSSERTRKKATTRASRATTAHVEARRGRRRGRG